MNLDRSTGQTRTILQETPGAVSSLLAATQPQSADANRKSGTTGTLSPDSLLPSRGTTALTTVLAEISREFGDEAHPRVSIRRAENLASRSGLGLDDFLDAVEEARTVTLAHVSAVTRRQRTAGGSVGRKNLMPYFFATLEGLTEPEEENVEGPVASNIAQSRSADRCGSRAVTDLSPQEMNSAQRIWKAVLDELRLAVAPEAFRRWLASTRVLGGDDSHMEVAVCDAIHQHWLEVRLRARIQEALVIAGGGATPQITYRIMREGQDDGAMGRKTGYPA